MAPAPWPLPPSRQYADWLGEAEVAGLLDWALSNQRRFKHTRVAGGTLDPARRVSRKLGDLGPYREVIEQRIAGKLPEIFGDLGVKPFVPDYVELELVAHGDGAFFATHADIPLGANRARAEGGATPRYDRIVSAVYYFHREPKEFSGGALRLYRLDDYRGQGEFTEFEPRQNSLVVFPSWAPHEVRKVHLANPVFEASRFAVNIWLCRRANGLA